MISNILIIGSTDVLYNITIQNKEISTFTTYGAGLLLYETNTNTFDTLTFENGSIIKFNAIPSIDFTSSAFKPFDNQSFLLLNSNSLAEVDFMHNGNRLILEENKSYMITNSNHPNNQQAIEALELNNEKFYAYCGINTNNLWEVAVANINSAPTEFMNSQPSSAGNSLIGWMLAFLVLAGIGIPLLSLKKVRTQKKYLQNLRRVLPAG